MLLTIALTILLAPLVLILYDAFLGPLQSFPGPPLARFTNLWRFVDVWRGESQLTLRRLHREYDSKVIRLGPNLLSLSDARWVKLIYSLKGDFTKTKAYSVNDIKLPDGTVLPTTFSVRDEGVHTEMMKPIQKLYNLNNVLIYEAQINQVMETFVDVLSAFANRCKIDIGVQLDYLAYDVISNITLGAPNGYLQKQSDFDSILGISDRVWDYFARVSQLPWLDNWLAKSNISFVSKRFPSFAQNMHRRCVEHITTRLKKSKATDHKDFLEDFIEIGGGREKPDIGILVAWLSSNIVAGSDTIAIQLKAAVYHILKDPTVHEKLQKELDSANISPPFAYRDVKELPYLDAVIKESMRVHPGVGMLLEREVPQPGVQLPNGPWLEGGTCVGMNPWVVHLDEVFGQHPEEFMPERWLCDQDEGGEDHTGRVRRMLEADLTFGHGRRICSGKFVALVELYKILASLFWYFDIELADPSKEWQVMNSWFTRQKGIEVYVKRRSHG